MFIKHYSLDEKKSKEKNCKKKTGEGVRKE